MLTPYDVVKQTFHEINILRANNAGKIVVCTEIRNTSVNFDFTDYLFDMVRYHGVVNSNELIEFFERVRWENQFYKELCEYLNSIMVSKTVYDEYPEAVLITDIHKEPIQLNIKKMIDAGFAEIPDNFRDFKHHVFLDQAKLYPYNYFEYYKDKPDTYSYAVYHHFNTIMEISKNIDAGKDITSLVLSILQSEHSCKIDTIINIFNDFIIPYSDKIRKVFNVNGKLGFELYLFY